ncbi:MAG: site-specific DNA-methyltransferase, partial [Prevotellaceae bacterium]|nr:site-specific DNA-methyltransferase [Prevotellaceae bacterium]
RLKLARNLLSDDGVIFISIDDNEQANLKLLCDEVFGEENFISNICVKSRASVSNDKIISPNHNFILLYAKNQEKIFEKREFFGVEKSLMGFNLIDEKGKYKLVPVDGPGGAKKGNPYYTFLGVKGYWRFSKKTMEEKYKKGLIVRIANGLQQKYYKETAAESKQTVTSWWDNKFYTSEATRKLNELLGDGIFDTPKPIELIKRILQLSISNSPLILDFFAGSGTTAHAVMQLNAEDGGNRKWICVQLDEKCDEKSEAYKAGYKTIDEISRERIRRAAKQLCPQIPQANTKLFDVNNLRESADLGFRALKVDDDNFKAVRRPLGEIEQMSLAFDVDNIKKDRTPLDLLFGCLTAMALELNRPLKTRAIGETDIFLYDYADEGNGVVACFADSVPEEVAKEIAKLKPLTALFKDSSFATSVDKVNLYEHFRIVSPETKVRVI